MGPSYEMHINRVLWHTERFVAYHETSAATAHFGMQGYFYFWVILSFVWGLVAAFLAFTLPIWESRFIG